MKILVDEMPKSGNECLFRDYHSIGNGWNHWTCLFRKSTVCSLDCGKECEYLMATNKPQYYVPYKEVAE